MKAFAGAGLQPDLYATTYDRAACGVGIVHVGYGAFHRAHQAVYLDDYMSATGDFGWGIAAVNLRREDSQSFAKAGDVEDGYLLKTTTPGGNSQFRLVRAHCHFADWSHDAAAAEALLSRPTIHAITLTVTESGYFLDDNGNLNLDDPVIVAERSTGASHSVYAYLAGALARRVDCIDQPINILCCDNIRSNGAMLERNFLTYLDVLERDALADWVRENVSFPNSMVDRITPRSTSRLDDEISEIFSDHRLRPIHTEAFSQWVLQDRFAAPMPELDRVGVNIVGDVDPYEEAKIRILNGGHTGLCYLGALAGYSTFDEVMRDPRLREFFDAFQNEEVLPGLNRTLPFDKKKYLADVTARFGNAAIADQIERLCMDGYSKMPIYIRPTLKSCLEQGIEPRHTYRSIASWFVFARRFAVGKMPIDYLEPYWKTLQTLLEPGREPAFACSRHLWGELPEEHADFARGILHAIDDVEQKWPA